MREVFTTANGKLPAGMDGRAFLLRDAATVLCEKYQGDLVGQEFLKMLNGLDAGAPEEGKMFPLPVFSANLFF